NVPDYVAVHQPTTDNVNAQALARGIKTAVAALFGDYGSGATESNLSGMYHCSPSLSHIPSSSRTSPKGDDRISHTLPSEISLPRNLNMHQPHLPHALPPRLGCPHTNGRNPRPRGFTVRLPRRPRERHHPEGRAGGRQEGTAAHPRGER